MWIECVTFLSLPIEAQSLQTALEIYECVAYLGFSKEVRSLWTTLYHKGAFHNLQLQPGSVDRPRHPPACDGPHSDVMQKQGTFEMQIAPKKRSVGRDHGAS